MKHLFLLLTFLLSLGANIQAQSLRELQEQRKKTEASIALTNKLLQQNRKNKNKELSNLKLLSQKISYRKKLIDDIGKETDELARVIALKEQTIDSYSTDLEKMKNEYAELLQFIWARRSVHQQMMYVLAGKDIAQIYRRFRLLNEYSNYQKTQAQAIEELATRLSEERDSLYAKRQQQTQLLTKYNTENNKLNSEKTNKQKSISQLKQKESKLKKQLIAQQKKRDKLKKFVDKLIAEEARKATKNASGKMQLTPEQQITSDQFAGNRGRLPWPVASGVITEKYGKHKHEVYKRVEVENDGIDIRTEKGSNARAIFEGTVTSVNALPGYNKGVIIRHGEYCTFYANLIEVYVKKGDKVSTKQKIGKVFTDQESSTLIHFEVWKGMNKQNPQSWLSK